MNVFYYSAFNSEGAEISGLIEATDAASASRNLRDQGLFPTSIVSETQHNAQAAPKGQTRTPSATRAKLGRLVTTPLHLPRFSGRYPALEIIIRIYRWAAIGVAVSTFIGVVVTIIVGLFTLHGIQDWR